MGARGNGVGAASGRHQDHGGARENRHDEMRHDLLDDLLELLCGCVHRDGIPGRGIDLSRGRGGRAGGGAVVLTMVGYVIGSANVSSVVEAWGRKRFERSNGVDFLREHWGGRGRGDRGIRERGTDGKDKQEVREEQERKIKYR